MACRAFARGDCSYGDSCKYSHGDGAGGGGGFGRESRPRGVCYAYSRDGHCDRGDECRFSHDGEPGAGAGEGTIKLWAILWSDSCERRCKLAFWRCMLLDTSCGPPVAIDAYGKHERPSSEVRFPTLTHFPLPLSHNTGRGGGGFGGSRTNDKCYRFQRGECTRGDSCKYSHEVDDAFQNFGGRPRGGGGGGFREGGGGGGRGECFAFQRGECNRGSACRFSHGGAGESGDGGFGSGMVPSKCLAFQRGECNRGDDCKFSHE